MSIQHAFELSSNVFFFHSSISFSTLLPWLLSSNLKKFWISTTKLFKMWLCLFSTPETIVWDGGWRKSQISHFLLVLVQDMPYDFLWYCTHPKLFWIWSINTRYVHFHFSFQDAEQSVQVAAEVKASHQFFQCRHCCLILANVFIYENNAIIYLDFNQVPIVLVN